MKYKVTPYDKKFNQSSSPVYINAKTKTGAEVAGHRLLKIFGDKKVAGCYARPMTESDVK